MAIWAALCTWCKGLPRANVISSDCVTSAIVAKRESRRHHTAMMFWDSIAREDEESTTRCTSSPRCFWARTKSWNGAVPVFSASSPHRRLARCLNCQRGRLSRHLSRPPPKNATLAKAAFFSQGADVRCRASVAYADVNEINAAIANNNCAAPFIFEFGEAFQIKFSREANKRTFGVMTSPLRLSHVALDI